MQSIPYFLEMITSQLQVTKYESDTASEVKCFAKNDSFRGCILCSVHLGCFREMLGISPLEMSVFTQI